MGQLRLLFEAGSRYTTATFLLQLQIIYDIISYIIVYSVIINYYVKIFSEKFDYRAMTKDMNQKYVLYKIGDISQNTICPCVIVGIDTTKIPIDKMNAAGEKDKKYYFKGQCFLMHVSAKIVNQKIAPGHNTITVHFVLPYIIVSDSNDIEIRKEE